MGRVRILLADDHTLVRQGLRKVLEERPEWEVVAEASDGREAVRLAEQHRPDVAILDVAMPLLNGLDAARQIHAISPSIRLIFLTMNDDPDLAAEAFRAGATAYLLKRSPASELLTAIRQAMKSRKYVTPLITEGMLGALMNPMRGETPRHELTSRQREVLQLLAEGKSMKDVANILAVAPRTVAFHKYRMMEQLRIKTNAELIQFAVREHLV